MKYSECKQDTQVSINNLLTLKTDDDDSMFSRFWREIAVPILNHLKDNLDNFADDVINDISKELLNATKGIKDISDGKYVISIVKDIFERIPSNGKLLSF
jgi:hypothetical protein